jgi:phosphocarrier protein HPr
MTILKAFSMNKDCDVENNSAVVLSMVDQPLVTRKMRIVNPLGLHARPSANLVRMLRDRQSEVSFTFRNTTVDARSILGLLMLAAPRNAWITVSVKGPDAVELVEELERAFKNKFGEDA